jgi:peroxiredoxin Q/BCP
MLETGTKAPEFTLADQNGEMHSLSDYRGQKVILYFYPKDSTAGCTKEACGFRDRYPDIREKGAVILGVSKDSVKSHKNFEEKQELPFTLLSDPDKEVIQLYDVWQEKTMYGKKVFGVERSTYLIDEDGVIIKTYRKVKAASLIFALLMGLARIYLVVHYPSDVVAGMIVGIFAGSMAVLIAQKLPRKWYQWDVLEKKKAA